MGGGASGKGTSQAKTEQTVTNKQVATQSGIALGSDANNNTINVQSADPEVAKTAIAGVTIAESQALNFAGRAGEAALATSDRATQSAIQSTTFLASKVGDVLGENARQNIGLLQSVAQNSTDVALKSESVASAALDKSFDVAKSTAPQDPSYALQTTIGKVGYIIAAIVVAGIVAVFAFRSKRA